jgi:catechol 2,3-dioxygenase-like lactoylglutathione lyase family enzyme
MRQSVMRTELVHEAGTGIDPIGLRVSNLERSKAFFSKASAPLGYTLLLEQEISGAGFGTGGKPDFWIKRGEVSRRVHVAIASSNRATVAAFYAVGVAAGDRSDGAPDLRPEYHPSSYGAFVLNPDGSSVEAICHSAG